MLSKLGNAALCLSFIFLLIGIGHAEPPSESLDSHVRLTFQTEDPNQVLFLIGVGELQKGNYKAAVQIFEALGKATGSLRVKLELARALFLDRRYKDAQEIFLSVYENPDIPLTVRENIKLYLDEIDSSLGTVKFSFEIVNDSNPLNFTDSRQIKIAGQTLTLEPPSENKEVIGVKFGVKATKSFTNDATVLGYLNAAFSDYAGGSFDRFNIDGGILIAPINHRKIRAKAGIEESIYAGSHLYGFPYAAIMYTPDPYNQFKFNTELKYGVLDVKEADYLDAEKVTLAAYAKRELPNDAWMTSSVYLENANTNEDPYSYQGAGISGELSYPVSHYWGFKILASLAYRGYDDRDPIFGDVRRDNTQKVGVSFFSRLLKIDDYEPEVGVVYEQNNSTLGYYEYDKLSLIFRLAQ